jgi:hypothetical protein
MAIERRQHSDGLLSDLYLPRLTEIDREGWRRFSEEHMPPFRGKDEAGWISSDRLQRIPPQQLQPTDVELYLNHLFGDIARRPRPIHLRKEPR